MRARHTSGGDNNGAWSSPWSDTVTARVKDDLPTAPTGLTTSRVAHDSITLSWTTPTQGTVTGYRIFRGTDADSLAAIVQDTGNIDVEKTDSTVSAGTTYHYAVLALSQDGDGAQSATVNATTPAQPRSKKDDPKGGTPDTDRPQRGAGDATGKPAISAPNVFRVPAVLTANRGNIADTDGIRFEYDSSTLQQPTKFNWQWVRVNGSTETDITGATGETYRLTAADVGKTIKVKGSFTDNADNDEGPLKSDATATITAASSCNPPSQARRGSRQVNTGTLIVGKFGSDYGFSPTTARSAFDNPHFRAEQAGFTTHSLMVTAGGDLRLETTFEMEEPTRNYFTLYVCGEQFHFKDATVSRISMPGRRHDGNLAYGSRLTWSGSGLDWSSEAQRTIHFYRDSTAPTVVSVEVTELSRVSLLTITFTEELNLRILPHPSAFAVKKTPAGGSEQTATFTGISYHGKYTWGRALTEVVLPTYRVTVSYDKPTDLLKLKDCSAMTLKASPTCWRASVMSPPATISPTPTTRWASSASDRIPTAGCPTAATTGATRSTWSAWSPAGPTASRSFSTRRAAPKGFLTSGTSGGTTTPPAPQWAATSGWRNVAISTDSILSANGTATTTAEPSLNSKPAGTSPATPVGSPLSQTTT